MGTLWSVLYFYCNWQISAKKNKKNYTGVGVILPGVERDGIFPQFFRGIGTGRDYFFVRVGRERFENSLPCHPLYCIAHFISLHILLLIFFLFLFYSYLYLYILSCYVSFFLHCPLSGPVLLYISLLIISCIIEYVTNKRTLNLDQSLYIFFSSLIFWVWLFVTYGIDTEVLHSGIVPKPKLWYRAIPNRYRLFACLCSWYAEPIFIYCYKVNK